MRTALRIRIFDMLLDTKKARACKPRLFEVVIFLRIAIFLGFFSVIFCG